MTYVEIFFLLQILDFMTTLTGLRMGGAEVSPFVAWVMRFSDPVTGLSLIKLLGFGLGALCLWLGKQRVIISVNYLFAMVVLWNSYHILRAIGQAP